MKSGSTYSNWLRREERLIDKIDRSLAQEAARRGSIKRGFIRVSQGVVKRQAVAVQQ